MVLVSVALCAGVFATPAVASASAGKAVAFHCALHRQRRHFSSTTVK
jgi:hypothetical protein